MKEAKIFIIVTIGDEFDEIKVKPTISLKNIVTLSKLSAITYMIMNTKILLN